MNSAIRKVLVLACGVAAAIALGAPASAHAATAAATTPDLHASNCATGPSPQDFQLVSYLTSGRDEIDDNSTPHNLYIGGGTPRSLCQALVSTGIVQIFTSSADTCLAYSQAANNAYEHVATGCTLAAPPNYMQWKFIFQFNAGTAEGPVYELQTQFPDPQNGEKKCLVEIANTRNVTFDTCDGRDSELFFAAAV